MADSETNEEPPRGPTPHDDYLHVIKHTQLISCDLIIYNEKGQILLGERNNEPAKGDLFVPGGRVFKYETLTKAQKRIAQNELNITLPEKSNFRGIFHHTYNNNFANDKFGTHYIVFAYIYNFDKTPYISTQDDQHNTFCWLTPDEIMQHPNVNNYVKNYFSVAPFNDAVLM